MKKLIIGIFIILLIPYLVVSFLLTNKKNEIYVKVKIENKIKKVPLENYVECVLQAEAPLSFEDEALKAISVSIRTYALKRIDSVIDNTTKYQVYINKKVDKRIKKIVKSTKGEYLVYNDLVIDALYFSTSVGKTENSEEVFLSKVSYLKSVESKWDISSPMYSETKTFDINDFYTKLNLEKNANLNIEILNKTNTGRIKEVKINNVIFSGDTLREKLNLRSNYFEITKLDSNVLIKTLGYGHGVGLSLYGANGMAKEGYKYVDILKYYYQGVKIKKIIV